MTYLRRWSTTPSRRPRIPLLGRPRQCFPRHFPGRVAAMTVRAGKMAALTCRANPAHAHCAASTAEGMARHAARRGGTLSAFPGRYSVPAGTTGRPHVETYYLRVNDFLTLTFIESRKKSAEHYRVGVGDELQIEWLQGAGNTETPLNRKLLVQPDGTVTLPLIGEVLAAGKTVSDFHDEVVKLYSKYQREPQITVT